MSTNYENAVHRRRRMSMVNDSNANRQEDSRLALELKKIEREKQKLTRRKSAVLSMTPKRRSSLAETRMMRTLSKHDLYLPTERGRRSSMDSVSTDSTVSSDSMNRSLPYTELIDKERFDKFCSDTQKLSLTTSDVHNLKDQLNIREHDPTGFMGDMNIYLRKSNANIALKRREQTDKEYTEQADGTEDLEGNIMWDNYIHPRTLEEIQA